MAESDKKLSTVKLDWNEVYYDNLIRFGGPFLPYPRSRGQPAGPGSWGRRGCARADACWWKKVTGDKLPGTTSLRLGESEESAAQGSVTGVKEQGLAGTVPRRVTPVS
jgi:hypothetical protein